MRALDRLVFVDTAIRTGHDALAVEQYVAADAIITNPPYTRELMHALIEYFQRICANQDSSRH